ncbi:hypothetical protein ACFQ1R_05710 [Mariniflexile jejuense]|uniref:Uncharacterized protein n=1 Tax=Mariniflexile jejuense TaxID=1173582 RepID=A0ABW3JJ58_9FLAO
MNKNYGFKVSLNNKPLTHAGIKDEHYVVTCILDSFNRTLEPKKGLNLNISGLKSTLQQRLKWIDTPLKLGDKITIEIISDNYDEPALISESKSKETILEGKIRAYKKLKEELKDYLNE